MTGLLSSLHNVSNALDVYTQALGVEQRNVSNSATPGYAAVNAQIQPLGFGQEDKVVLQSTGSTRTDAIVNAATSQASDSQTQTQQLISVNQQFDITGTSGILAAFQQFSTAFSQLSVTPGDPSLATTALAAANNVASAFNSISQNLSVQSQSLQADTQTTVTQINNLASQIAGYNAAVRGQTTVDPGTDAALRTSLTQLSSLVGVTVNQNDDGTVNVLAGNAIPLVLGGAAYSLTANLNAASGSQITGSGGGTQPPSFSGTLGGLVDSYNNTIAPILGGNGQAGSLNTLAQGFASSVNSVLSSGITASGTPGAPLFTWNTSDPAATAGSLAVDPTVTTDQLALATGSQSNGIANQLAALTSSNNTEQQINGLSTQDYYASIAQSVGQKLSDASAQSTADQTTLTAAQADQTATEGVSLDNEAVNISAYQRSWEAAAKLVSVIDNLTLDAVNLVGIQDS